MRKKTIFASEKMHRQIVDRLNKMRHNLDKMKTSTPSNQPETTQTADSIEESRLLQQIGVGDRASFDELHRRMNTLLFSIAMGVLNNREAAQDDIQDVFIQIWERAASYDAERGKAVYAQNCLVCHALDGQGGKVGPELTGIGARDRADILTEILDPNRSVVGYFSLYL